VSRINAEACNKPKRSRTSELLAPLVLEILAMMFLGARFYSRWITIRRFETDDIVMLVTGV
jgi:hypothetical protein